MCHILANRQILGKKRDLLFRHNGDLARTHKYTHTHTSAVSVSSWPIYLDDSNRLGIPAERASVCTAIISHFHKDLAVDGAVNGNNKE